LFKIYLRRIHLFLAVITGLFLINLSVSGALLLFAKEIQIAINPQYWLVTQHEKSKLDTLLPLSALTEKIERQIGQKINFIEIAESSQSAWQVRLANNNYLSIDPYTGDILFEHSFYNTFYGFVMTWHRWLFYSKDNGEKPFQMWISIAALTFTIELLLGCYLWAKPRHRLKRLKIRWQAKNRILLNQLHGTIGVLFCIPLILIAFSGIAFFWQDAGKQVVEWLTLTEIEQHNYQHKPLASHGKYNLNQAYDSALSALPGGKVYRIYLPKKSGDPLALRIRMPNESHAYSWSWADPYSGQLIESFDASRASAATQVWNFKYKFHIGEFIGWPVKVLWLLLSLLPCFFVITGMYLWCKRKQCLQSLVVKFNTFNGRASKTPFDNSSDSSPRQKLG
tara:strand:- start:1797 stop:2978 length:1182 start_codon:yes stop_codon:yes gene_type:complete